MSESASPFDRLLIALDLLAPASSARDESLAPTLLSTSVDLHPHQVEAAIFALTRRRGAVLADEVGLGKTIEAGLVIAQLLAEGAKRILVLVPASLRGQWRAELGRFFGIDARLVDLAALRRERGHFSTRGVHIASINFFPGDSNPEHFRDADWDLVVIDEAHRLRNVWRPGAKRARRLREVLRGKRKLLLTATPFQNSLLELYGLISFVDDKLLGTEASFRGRFLADERGLLMKGEDDLRARLATVVARTLRRQVLDTIRFTARKSLLYEFEPLPRERELYERVSDYLGRSRTIALTFGNRELLLLGYRKILASSTFAVAATLRRLVVTLAERLAGRLAAADLAPDLDGLDEEAEELGAAADASEAGEAVSGEEIEREIAELRSYIELADSIDRNAKGERLVAALGEVLAQARDKGWPEKAVIFTESRRTQEYLRQRLEEAGYRGRITLFHGGSGDAGARDALIEEFRARSTILIATEAGAEGLNLQFCNVVVNYDLPWNPQRIEQRIGRCHRYGQQLDVLVVNFLNRDNAADRRLFELLSAKLTLFDGVFGASDEVLGPLESGVDFERRVLEIYQTCRTSEEIDRGFDRLQREIEEVAESRLAETRSLLLDHFDEEVRSRLAVRKRTLDARLVGLESRVRALVLGTVAAVAVGEGVHRLELPAAVALGLPAGAIPAAVRFTPGAEGVFLGPRHPLVAAIARHVVEVEGAPRVHDLAVSSTGVLEALRGRRGYWFLHRVEVESGSTELSIVDVALLEGEDEPLSAAERRALREAPRRHVGYSALGPPEALGERAVRRAIAETQAVAAAARARAARAVEDEKLRLERFAAEVAAESERGVERSRAAARRARGRSNEVAADPRASEEQRRQAGSFADLLEGQVRHEEALFAEDGRRRQREVEAGVSETEARLEVRARAELAAIARFWLV